MLGCCGGQPPPPLNPEEKIWSVFLRYRTTPENFDDVAYHNSRIDEAAAILAAAPDIEWNRIWSRAIDEFTGVDQTNILVPPVVGVPALVGCGKWTVQNRVLGGQITLFRFAVDSPYRKSHCMVRGEGIPIVHTGPPFIDAEPLSVTVSTPRLLTWFGEAYTSVEIRTVYPFCPICAFEDCLAPICDPSFST